MDRDDFALLAQHLGNAIRDGGLEVGTHFLEALREQSSAPLEFRDLAAIELMPYFLSAGVPIANAACSSYASADALDTARCEIRPPIEKVDEVVGKLYSKALKRRVLARGPRVDPGPDLVDEHGRPL